MAMVWKQLVPKKNWAFLNVIYNFFTAINPTPASSYVQGKTFLTTLIAVSDQMNFNLNDMVDLCFHLHYTLRFLFLSLEPHARQTERFRVAQNIRGLYITSKYVRFSPECYCQFSSYTFTTQLLNYDPAKTIEGSLGDEIENASLPLMSA